MDIQAVSQFVLNNMMYIVGILGVLVIIMYGIIINLAMKAENQRLDGILQTAITHVGVVRFRAFEDMGSDLSYAVALLDAHHNGVILSSIFGREDSRSYVKPIKDGQSSYTLSEEEKQALHEAMQS